MLKKRTTLLISSFCALVLLLAAWGYSVERKLPVQICDFPIVPMEIKQRPAPVPSQNDPAAENWREVKFMQWAHCYAGSRIKDTEAPGGFGASDNFPLPIESAAAKAAPTPYLLAQPDVLSILGKDKDKGDVMGMTLLLVNPSDKLLAFPAQDSVLSILQEAKDDQGEWRAIEYPPQSFCGNSYHRVMLPANHYWSFRVPRYKGSLQTMLRFRFSGSNGVSYLSNEFKGSVNPEQFAKRQGHVPQGIMDPNPAEQPR